jgi:hypothetical protein
MREEMSAWGVPLTRYCNATEGIGEMPEAEHADRKFCRR